MKNTGKMVMVIFFVAILLRIINAPIAILTCAEYGLTGAQSWLDVPLTLFVGCGAIELLRRRGFFGGEK